MKMPKQKVDGNKSIKRARTTPKLVANTLLVIVCFLRNNNNK